MASASPRYPSSDAALAAAGSSLYGSGSPEPAGFGHVPGQGPSGGGYATGPYSTGGAAAPAQQGFYSPTHTPGPAALTADARGGYQPGMEYAPGAATSSGSPGGFATPAHSGHSPNFPAGSGHGMMDSDFGSADPYGAPQYPGTGSAFGAFPATPGPAGWGGSGYGTDPYAAVAPPHSGIPAYGNPASTYPDVPEAYGNPPFGHADSFGGYPTAPATSTGANHGYQAPAGGFASPAPPVSGSPASASGYRPGSTGRGSDALSPAGAAHPAGFGGASTGPAVPSGGPYYPSTYSR